MLFDLREEEQTCTSQDKRSFAKDMAIIKNNQHAQEVDRYNVPSDVLCLGGGEAATDSGDEEASVATADSVDSSTDQDTPMDGSSLSPLAEDLEQHSRRSLAVLKDCLKFC